MTNHMIAADSGRRPPFLQTGMAVVGAFAGAIAVAGVAAMSVKVMGFAGPLMIIVGVAAVFAAIVMVLRPGIGVFALFTVAYICTGLSRYVPGPLGLSVDGVLVLLLTGVLLANWYRPEWRGIMSPSFVGIMLWTLLCVAQLGNPNAASRVAWFFAVRGVALYWLFGYPVFALLLNPDKGAAYETVLWRRVKPGLAGQTPGVPVRAAAAPRAGTGGAARRIDGWQLVIWATIFILSFSCAGALWGLKQVTIGLDPFEYAWLQEPGNLSTHMLFGRLRVFSFFSDTGQFGINMAYTSLMAVILACGPWPKKVRIALWCAAALLFIGLGKSGTRSAYIGFLAGFPVFFLLRRNIRIVIIGGLVIGSVVGVLKYTHIGQGNYTIQRMRQAVNPMDDPSFLVRLENQRRLADYLKSHPFGGGIGSAGYWGARFSPGTFLANLALDSWYVKIAAEQGQVGLVLYVAFIIFLGVRGVMAGWRERDPARRNLLEAYASMYWGVALASYSNQYLGQIPTGIIMLFSVALFEFALRQSVAGGIVDPVRRSLAHMRSSLPPARSRPLK
ncbi:MAG: O-antigen ligase family protein [bacterium]|nr:O-antigen ligase family protein [Candidatus Sumerlaeota bacterium]